MSRSPTCWRNTRKRDPGKTAIVDLESGTTIDFGQLDRVAIDIAAYLKSKGIRKGSRVLVLSDECLEKLLIWFGVWRIGAVICPFNLEINEKQMVSLTAALNPALILYHKDIDVAAMVGDAPAERVRFGAWSAEGAKDPQDELFVALPRGDAAALPERNNADDTACIFCTSGTTARPKIVIYNHAAYWMNGLDTLEFLGLTEDDRTLEYRSFGWNSAQVLEPAAVPAEGADHAHRQAVLAQPFLRMGAAARHHLLGRRADRAQHPAEQADRLHREGRADACG